MPTDRDADESGAAKRPHCDAQHWLEHNLTEEEAGPVTHVDHDDDTDQEADASGARDQGEGTLVQLPVGATFGMDHDPTPQEREELVRFVGAADAELRGQDDRQTGGTTERDEQDPETRR
ncbi:hypothetical protein ACQE98_17530 [Ornithinimicrobium sp. W1679]|uniref:hypothetical protein n=1 Tax=Ornithinimicrobium sp. W1679 TaxID=3418770 RepID=UPI003CFA02EA